MIEKIKSFFGKSNLTAKEELLANELVNVKDIIGNILYTKDDYLFSYIRVKPISIELLSDREIRIFIERLTEQLSVIQHPYKLFLISRPTDLSSLLHEKDEAYRNSTDNIKKNLIRQSLQYMNELLLNGDVVERQYYFVLWTNNSLDAVDEIIKKSRDFRLALVDGGLQSEIINEVEIIKLCNLFMNASSSVDNTDYVEGITSLDYKI